MDRDGLWYNGGVGALVTVALSFVPFSSVLGGAVAANGVDGGYLSGLKLGTSAGVLAAVPLLALFVPALAVVRWLGFGIPASSSAYDLFLALVFLLFLLYTVGLSALGGLVGVRIRERTSWDLDPSRWI